MEGSTTDSMCRCCAAEGIFKDIKTSYHWMGEEEVYGDMLRECFDVKLATIEEGGICEVCITQLRNAANFKKQVLHTEKKFKRHLETRRFKPAEVKEEDGNSSDDMDRDDDSEEDEDYVPDFEMPIKTETTDESKTRKRGAKATTSRAKKSKTDSDDKSRPRLRTITISKIKREPRKEAPKIELIKTSSFLFRKLQDNLEEILKNSNATLIRRVNGLDYICAYCDFGDRKPAALKKHTLAAHCGEAIDNKRKSARELLVKLDITSLNCNICCQDIDTVEQLLTHLQSEHDIKIHTDIKNQIIPFKFGKGPLTCFICNVVFPSFKVLQEHVNVHYANYICLECGSGFVNTNRLKKHQQNHVTGSFSCEHCSKEFTTQVAVKNHVKQVHGKILPLKCWHCSERFSYNQAKEKHMADVHNVVFPPAKCETCDKIFPHRSALRAHTKRVHLLDRRFDCPQCDMKFHTSREVKNHMLKHTGDRHFECEICLKRFLRKTALTEHMRIHNNERRFKCEHCGMTFVQKCSWKGHMQSKHGDIM